MKRSVLKYFAILAVSIAGMSITGSAQEYVSPIKPAETGKSPGVRVKLLSTNGGVKTYMLIFSTGDEVVSGLTEFATRYNVKSAHYTGIGDADSARVGWYDKSRKMFKAISINEASEITSLTGDVAVFNNKPVAHTHINVATSDGVSHDGHLLQLYVGPTLEVSITVEPTGLYKKLDANSGAGVIDPSLGQ